MLLLMFLEFLVLVHLQHIVRVFPVISFLSSPLLCLAGQQSLKWTFACLLCVFVQHLNWFSFPIYGVCSSFLGDNSILSDMSFSKIWFLFVAVWVFCRGWCGIDNHSSSSRHPPPLLLWNRSTNQRWSHIFYFKGFNFGSQFFVWVLVLFTSLIEVARGSKGGE